MTFRNVLLLLFVGGFLGIGGYVAREIHAIRTEASQTAETLQEAANKLGVAVDDGTARVVTSVHEVSTKIDNVAQHVDAAVDRTGASVNQAVSDAINPLPGRLPSFLKIPATAAPSPSHVHQNPPK